MKFNYVKVGDSMVTVRKEDGETSAESLQNVLLRQLRRHSMTHRECIDFIDAKRDELRDANND